MKYFSMFSGIGGFEYGIQKAIKAECVGYSEINKYAIAIYDRHFKHRAFGDVSKINTCELPEFDLLAGGFPCQSFSIAGLRGGFDDSRGTLFFEIARILKDKKPTYFLLENVKGLLSHDKGRTFSTILRILTDLGYIVQWKVLNSKDFGVPQNRERVFFVGHLRGRSGFKVLPFRENNSRVDEGSEQTTANTFTAGGHSGGMHSSMTLLDISYYAKSKCQSHRVYNTDGLSPTLAGASKLSGDCTPKISCVDIGASPNFQSEFLECSPALKATRSDYLLKPIYRRLTPVECERLQGFPDGWTEGVSDTQRYKCLGNAVTTNVIEYLIGEMFKEE